MDLDTGKIDDAVLGLLYLTLHDGVRAWKSMDWAAMSRLHEKRLIHDPANKAKSVVLTEAGVREAERICAQLFAIPTPSTATVRYGGATAEVRTGDGANGTICKSAVDGSTFFRVYSDDGSFADYALRHDDLRVTIATDAMAAFYRVGNELVLDHSPEVLGLQPASERRAPGA